MQTNMSGMATPVPHRRTGQVMLLSLLGETSSEAEGESMSSLSISSSVTLLLSSDFTPRIWPTST
jgi:hypothetical protein